MKGARAVVTEHQVTTILTYLTEPVVVTLKYTTFTTIYYNNKGMGDL